MIENYVMAVQGNNYGKKSKEEEMDLSLFSYHFNKFCMEKGRYTGAMLDISEDLYKAFARGQMLPQDEETWMKLERHLGYKRYMYFQPIKAQKTQPQNPQPQNPQPQNPQVQNPQVQNPPQPKVSKAQKAQRKKNKKLAGKAPSTWEAKTVQMTLDFSKRPSKRRRWCAKPHTALEKAFAESVKTNLRKYTKEAGMTLTQVAKETGIGASLHTLLYTDAMPTDETIQRIAYVLNIKPEELSGTEEGRFLPDKVRKIASLLDTGDEYRAFIEGHLDGKKPEDYPEGSQARLAAKVVEFIL